MIAQIDTVSGLRVGDFEVAMVQTGVINGTGVSRSRASTALGPLGQLEPRGVVASQYG